MESYSEIDRIIKESAEANPWLTYEEVKSYLRELEISGETYQTAIKYATKKLNI